MKKFAATTAKYIGKPFKDFSCMGFLHAFYTDLGIDVPDKFEDLSLDNYMRRFIRDPYHTQITLLKMVRSLGKPSSARFPHLGDLLVVSQRTTRAGVIRPGFLPAVYCGRGHAMSSFLKLGVAAFRLDANSRVIVARSLS